MVFILTLPTARRIINQYRRRDMDRRYLWICATIRLFTFFVIGQTPGWGDPMRPEAAISRQ